MVFLYWRWLEDVDWGPRVKILRLKKKDLPTEMTVGDRTYEVVNFLREGEESVVSNVMVGRSIDLKSRLGKDDGQYLLDHQNEIPEVFRGEVAFVFTNWCEAASIHYVYWNPSEKCWLLASEYLDHGHWCEWDRFLRRKA